MAAWQNATGPAPDRGGRGGPVRGVVHRDADAAVYELRRAAVGPELQPFVEHLWSVRWDLGRGPGHEVVTLPFPSVHLTVEDGPAGEVRHGHPVPATMVHGVPTRAFTVRLGGRGWVVGAKFRPGGWAAWSGRDASALTGRVLLAGSVEPWWADAGRAVLAAGALEERLDLLHAHLSARAVEPGPDYRTVLAVVAGMAAEPARVRVGDVAEQAGWSPRTLQRRFRRLVGVGPKWVLVRYRLQEAALELEQRPDADLAELASRHGWYDQPQMTADFRSVLGTTPAAYADQAEAAAGGRPVAAASSPRRPPW